MSIEQIGIRQKEGCQIYGRHTTVVQGTENTTVAHQLTAADSGGLVISAEADGAVFTLPTPVVGMEFTFTAHVAITSNSLKVITKTPASEFLIGGIHISSTTAGGDDSFPANGTTHVACTSNGTTTGGDIGGCLIFTAISTTQWSVRGHLIGSGTIATPFSTS